MAALRTKLTPPVATPFELARTEICDKVLHAEAARLVLLRAPAGFGKTSAMVQMHQRFEQAGVATAWLTLDTADNDLARFLVSLMAAVAGVIPGLAEAGEGGAGSADAAVLRLMDRLAARESPFALFLDDFELLLNPEVTGLVRQMVEALPPGGRIVVGSRGVPGLGIARLRTQGRLLEIDPSQLRFSVAEADHYLRQHRGLALEAEDVRRLHGSTEGWAAALWLASVSLERQPDRAAFIAGFSGSNADVVDYLVEDVLAHQPEPLRAFLLHTSILQELTPALCDTLCSRSDSAAVLAALEQANLFLMPLHADRSGYRYHGMFGEFLRAQLARTYPAEVPRLHGAAARWYGAQGHLVPAIEHALAAGDLGMALPLLQTQVPVLLEQGRVRLLSRWLDPLLAQGELAHHPELQALHAWAVCLARGPQAAAALLDRLDAMADAPPAVQRHRQALRLLWLALTDRIDEATPAGAALLASLPEHDSFVRGFLEAVLANLALIGRRYHDALKLADAARSRWPANDSGFHAALSEAAEGAVDLAQGRLRIATARLRLAVSGAGGPMPRTTNGNALAGVLLAEALYEAGELGQAERLLSVYAPLIRGVCIPDELIVAHVLLARIAFQRRDAEQALQWLAELEQFGHRDGLERVVASARLERVRLLLLEDRVPAARLELARCGGVALWSRVTRWSFRANEVETFDLAQARVAIACGHVGEAMAGLRRELDGAERVHRERRALSLRLLLAQVCWLDGQANKGMRLLARSVRFAAAEGYVRAFLDEGPRLSAMLRELRGEPTLLHAEGGGEASLAFIDRLLGDTAAPAAPAAPEAAPPPASSDVLTRKEIHVLRLAAEGLSNEEMAQRLFVAETTVRTHLRNINVKLDARNRMEAIKRARQAGLLVN